MTTTNSYRDAVKWCEFEHFEAPLPREPVVNVTHVDDLCCKFTLSNTDVSIANAIRRQMHAEVPTMAITTINVEQNDTVLFDEFIAHRLGLLPFTSHGVGDVPGDEGYSFVHDCGCFDGCPYCTAEFVLDVENNEDTTRNVTHFDLEDTGKYVRDGVPDHHVVRPFPLPDPDLTREEDNRKNGVLIVKMKKGQKLRMHCTVNKGISKWHAKHNPTATVRYEYHPIVELDREVADSMNLDQRIDFVRYCPAKVFGFDSEDRVVIKDMMKCHFCQECEEWSNGKGPNGTKVLGLVSVRHDTTRFHFTVESVGQRSAVDIVRGALRIFYHKFELFKKDAFGMDESEITTLK